MKLKIFQMFIAFCKLSRFTFCRFKKKSALLQSIRTNENFLDWFRSKITTTKQISLSIYLCIFIYKNVYTTTENDIFDVEANELNEAAESFLFHRFGIFILEFSSLHCVLLLLLDSYNEENHASLEIIIMHEWVFWCDC